MKSKRREIEFKIENICQLPHALGWAKEFATKGLAGGPVVLKLGRPRRSLDQNAKLWPMLQDVAKHCPLIIDGSETKATEADWKDVFTAALTKQTRMAKGIDGGIVFLGQHTSKMNKAQFSELIELIYAYGSEHGVKWSEPSLTSYQQDKKG